MVHNVPHLDVVAWMEFFGLLGRMLLGCNPLSRAPSLALLRVLDISSDELGDKWCYYVLDCVLDTYLGCCLEQLNLSGNCSCDGLWVVRVLRDYVQLHGFNQNRGLMVIKGSWMSPRMFLSLSLNELNVNGGGFALEVTTSCKDNVLNLKSLVLSDNGLWSWGCKFIEVLWSALGKNTCFHI